MATRTRTSMTCGLVSLDSPPRMKSHLVDASSVWFAWPTCLWGLDLDTDECCLTRSRVTGDSQSPKFHPSTRMAASRLDHVTPQGEEWPVIGDEFR